jgi:hypothetical protein
MFTVDPHPYYRRPGRVKDMIINKMRKFIYLKDAVLFRTGEIAQAKGALY